MREPSFLCRRRADLVFSVAPSATGCGAAARSAPARHSEGADSLEHYWQPVLRDLALSCPVWPFPRAPLACARGPVPERYLAAPPGASPAAESACPLVVEPYPLPAEAALRQLSVQVSGYHPAEPDFALAFALGRHSASVVHQACAAALDRLYAVVLARLCVAALARPYGAALGRPCAEALHPPYGGLVAAAAARPLCAAA